MIPINPYYPPVTPTPQQQLIVKPAAPLTASQPITAAKEDIHIELTAAEMEAAKQKQALTNQEAGFSNAAIAKLTKDMLRTLTNPRFLDMTIPKHLFSSLRQHVLNRHIYHSKQKLSDAQLVEQLQQRQKFDVIVLQDEAEQNAMFDAIAQVSAQLIQLDDAALQQKCMVKCCARPDTMSIKIELPIEQFPELDMFKTHQCFHSSFIAKKDGGSEIYEPKVMPTQSLAIIGQKIWDAENGVLSANNVPITIFPEAAATQCQFICEPNLLATLKQQNQRQVQRYRALAEKEQQISALPTQDVITVTTNAPQRTMHLADAPHVIKKAYPFYQFSSEYDQGITKPAERATSQGIYEPNDYTTYQGIFVDKKIIKGTLTSYNPQDHTQVSKYVGHFTNELFHGQGVMQYSNDDRYEGEWQQGKRHGQGVMQYSNGDIYEGEWQQDKRHDGKGTLISYDPKDSTQSSQYTGDFVNELFHGQGIMQYSNGDIYEGEWQQGKRHGQGKMIDRNGDIYEGNWYNDKRHSATATQPDAKSITITNVDLKKGIKQRQSIWTNDNQSLENQVLTYADGSEYSGSVNTNGERQAGTLTQRQDDGSTKIYTGTWQKDELTAGEMIFTSSKQADTSYKYTGKFGNLLHKHGKGNLIFANDPNTAEIHDGNWANDVLDPDMTNIYKGQVLNKIPHGHGAMFYGRDKYTYEGPWLNGQRQGAGAIIFDSKKTTKYIGEWQDDCLKKMQYPLISGAEIFYQCNFPQNIPHGSGTISLDNNAFNTLIPATSIISYDGTWESGSLIKGTAQYQNQDKYTGQFVNELFHGKGVMHYGNGDQYEGEWQQGKRHGQGTMTYAGGDTYTGNWRDDKKHSTTKDQPEAISITTSATDKVKSIIQRQSVWIDDQQSLENQIISYKDGGEYIGSVTATGERKDGVLTKTHKSGIKKYIGKWQDDGSFVGTMLHTLNGAGGSEKYIGGFDKALCRQGVGTLITTKGSTITRSVSQWFKDKSQKNIDTCCGEISNEHSPEHVTITFNGDKYEGRWENGELIDGTVNYKDSASYKGSFCGLNRHGMGTLRDNYGNVYQGTWENNILKTGIVTCSARYKEAERFTQVLANGEGTINYENSDTYQGPWLAGKRHGIGKIVYKKGGTYDGEWRNDEPCNPPILQQQASQIKPTVDTKPETKQQQSQLVIIFKPINQPQTISYKNGDRYTGALLNGLPHGEGTKFGRGDNYEGQWENGKLISGTIKYQGGVRYSGTFRDGHLLHGAGTRTLSNGDCYEGQWENGKLNRGTVRCEDGRVYTGDLGGLADLERNGIGTMTDNRGNVYEGTWVGNVLTNGIVTYKHEEMDANIKNKIIHVALFGGQGTIKYSNGDIYEGQWLEGKRHGKGKMVYKNGETYDGEWRNDEPYHPDASQQAISIKSIIDVKPETIQQQNQLVADPKPLEKPQTISYLNGDKYTGNIVSGKPEGFGTMLYDQDGYTYEGQWLNGLRQGEGKITFRATQAVYTGEWLKDELVRVRYPHLFGVNAHAWYQCKFAQNIPHGSGILELVDLKTDTIPAASVTTYDGTWENGNLISGAIKYKNGGHCAGIFAHGLFNGNGLMPLSNGDSYEGQWVSGKLISGTIKHQDGTQYFGTFRDGLLNGEGTVTLSNGAHCEGLWEKGSLIYGAVGNANGVFYAGTLFNSLPHGEGVMTFSNGDSYEGQWVNGKLISGTIKHQDGTQYFGAFRDGLLNGAGTMTFSNGVSYQGQWENGNLTHGTARYVNGKIYTGAFFNNLPHGKGAMTFDNGYSYEGRWENGQLIHGTARYADGKIYTGAFGSYGLAGKRHGAGILMDNHGNTYQGAWEEDELKNGIVTYQNEDISAEITYMALRNGQGTINYSNGDIYEGPWLAGKRHGKGKLFYQKGGVYDGEWRNDEPYHPDASQQASQTKPIVDTEPEIMQQQSQPAITSKLIKQHQTISYPGFKYTGDTVDGIPEGFGIITYPNGDFYRGKISNGEKHGIGVLVRHNDNGTVTRIQGEWQNNNLINTIEYDEV